MKKITRAAAFTAGTVIAMGIATPAFAGADSSGLAEHSPGVASGNLIQVPVHVPVDACGNTVDIIALLNPAFGSACVNAG
ncbi:chaplin [Streptomyces sp. NBC_00433]